MINKPGAVEVGYLRLIAAVDDRNKLSHIYDPEEFKAIVVRLAKVGYERMQEMADPGLSLARARETWQQHGRSEKWIQQRMTGQEMRNKLTDYWSDHDIKKGEEFAILTNIIHQEWSGVSVKAHKELTFIATGATPDDETRHSRASSPHAFIGDDARE